MEKTKKLLAIIVIMMILIGSFSLIFSNTVMANGEEDSTAQQGGENPQGGNPEGGEQQGGQQNNETYWVDFGAAQWVIDGVTVQAATQWVPVLDNGPVEIEDRDLIRVSNFNPDTMEIRVTAEDGFTATLSLVSNDETTLESANVSGWPNGTLTFSVVKKEVPDNEDKEDIDIDLLFEGTNMICWLNNETVIDDSDSFKNSFNGTMEKIGTTSPAKTNTFRFVVPFGDDEVEEFEINSVVYDVKDETNPDIRKEGADILITVPGAEKYTIRGEGIPNPDKPRTIIWANVDSDKNAEQYAEDMVLEHGSARVIKVYNPEGNVVNPDEYIGENSDEYGVDDQGFGWVYIKPDSRVIFEFIPEYGYQLTSVKANGFDLEPQETPNQYEYIMPKTNVHFQATFRKVEDKVETESKDIAGGEIALGKALEGGTAKLKVNDINLSEDKISNFEETAGEYKISKFLNIELFNIYFKGKDDDEDVWEKQIKELDKEATITLQLEESVDGNDIVIVHEKHDGTYEVIPATYDEATHTITFKTSAFSNYAIATKKTEETKKQEEYTVSNDGFEVKFTDDEGYDFILAVIDFTGLTAKEREEFGIPEDLFKKASDTVIENTKKYGTFIGLYDITIMDVEKDYTHDNEILLKIKLTDEMKKYNSYKLEEINGDDFSVIKDIEVKVEGDYLVATLSSVVNAYALNGTVVEESKAEETPEDTKKEEDKSHNPQTGDYIFRVSTIMVFAIIAFIISSVQSKSLNRKMRKH